LFVLELAWLGVGIFHLHLQLFLGVVLLDEYEVAADKGLVEILDRLEGVF
jgi:hypothetical protein